MLLDDAPIAEALVRTPIDGLDLVPSSIALAGAEVELAGVDGRERRLAHALARATAQYDDVLVDCPPSLGLTTVNALTAADGVLIPVQCEYYALEGLSQLVETIHLVREHLNPALEIVGAVLTMSDPRTNLSAEVESEVRRHLGSLVYSTVVPRSVRLSEAPSYGQPIATYRPDSKGADAYRAVADEYVRRHGQLVAVAGRSHAASDDSAREPGSSPAAVTSSGVARSTSLPYDADRSLRPTSESEAAIAADANAPVGVVRVGPQAPDPSTSARHETLQYVGVEG